MVMTRYSEWEVEPLKSVMQNIGVSKEVLLAMTTAERIDLWKKYQYPDTIGAQAEEAICDSPDQLKDPDSLKQLKDKVHSFLFDPLPEDYMPLPVSVTITTEDTIKIGGNEMDASPAKAASASDSTAIVPYKPYTATRTELEDSYAGIVNQGGTCYLNSTVQSLFHIPKFREIIYNIRLKENSESEFASITTALQNLFLALQTKKTPISTIELTQSFGWNVSDAHEQHDAHEMIQRLLEAFEMITQGTPVKEELHSLFYGTMLNYVRCLDTGYVSRNPTEFFDLELVTLKNASMIQSLEAKVRPEKLDGEYKREYEDGREPTKHPAEMGSVFLSMPPVLVVHPSRVDFDLTTFQRKMVETEWTFETKINFSRFVARDPNEGVEVKNDGDGEDDPELDYELLSVIMHQGTPFSGHYIAYTRFGDKWLKFNDTTVTEVPESSVLSDGFSTPIETKDYWGNKMTRPAYTRASVLVYIRSSLKEKLVYAITEANLPSSLHDNLKVKAERDELAKIEAEKKARQVSIRYLVADQKGNYLSQLGSYFGRDGPTDKFEADKDEVAPEIQKKVAKAAAIDESAIEALWMYPEYYWPNTSYYSAKLVNENTSASECAKGFILVQLKGTAPSSATEEMHPLFQKEDTETYYTSILDAASEGVPSQPSKAPFYSDAPSLIPLCVLKTDGFLEYLGVATSIAEVVKTLDNVEERILTADHLAAAEETKRAKLKPITVQRYSNDDLYGPESLPEAPKENTVTPIELTVEDKFSFCSVEKNVLKNAHLRNSCAGSILIAYPSNVSTSTVSNAYDRMCNPLAVTLYQLDDALTPEELCEIVICPSYTYEQLQEEVFEAMKGDKVPLLAPIRRMPASPLQIGFRCHDDKSDRPHKTMQLTHKYNYNDDVHTAQSILSNKGSIIIAKLYIEVLPAVISTTELDNHRRVCDIPLHLGYFYQRHFYMKEGRNIYLYEVFRIAMAQQLSGLPPEFRERVESRWAKSKEAYLANQTEYKMNPRVDLISKQSTFDPVFRLVQLSYNGTGIRSEHYDWTEEVTLDNYYDYAVDLLPPEITAINWTKYVKVSPQLKPYASSEITDEMPAMSTEYTTETAPTPNVGEAETDTQETPQQEIVKSTPPPEDDMTNVATSEIGVAKSDSTLTALTSNNSAKGVEEAKFPRERELGWYNLFHADRRYTDPIYGTVTSVTLPMDETLTGAELLDLILKQIGILPEDDRFPEVASPSGDNTGTSPTSSPSSASPFKTVDVYQTAKKTWKLVFKGRATKVLEPNVPYNKISSDVGPVEYIMLDHPQSTKARTIAKHNRAEQAIRIGIIASETSKLKSKHDEETQKKNGDGSISP